MMKGFILCLLAFAVLCSAAPMDHLISALPGLVNSSGVKFRQFAGYVTVDESHGRKLFYWFVESQRNPSQDPLVLWMNGGPGSSSLIGFFMEHGPFRARSDGNIEIYPQSWNNVANVLYVEAPAGVGFSTSNNKSDYDTDDQKTAADNYVFLKNWFELFPEYKKHELYLAGESYAGHYIPTLVHEILVRDTEKSLNVCGLMLGDPLTNQDSFLPFLPGQDAWAYMGFFFHHGLISQESYELAFKECDFATSMMDCSGNYSSKSDECWNAIFTAIAELPDPLDYYNIDAEVCESDGLSRLQYTAQWSGITRFAMNKMMKAPKARIPQPVTYEQNNKVDPCLENYIPLYLNRDEVQKAIHADKMKWKQSGGIHYGTIDDNMIPIYHEIFNNPRTSSWRILVYSGDFDVVVPFLSTQRWVRCLGRPVTKPWHSWMIGKQVGGNIIEYDRISFLTIKGSGHTVPYYTPDKGLAFFQLWIDKQDFY